MSQQKSPHLGAPKAVTHVTTKTPPFGGARNGDKGSLFLLDFFTVALADHYYTGTVRIYMRVALQNTPFLVKVTFHDPQRHIVHRSVL